MLDVYSESEVKPFAAQCM